MTLNYEHLLVYANILMCQIPDYVYEGLACIFCISSVILLTCKGIKDGARYSFVILFFEYVFLILCSTVVFRDTLLERKYDFHLFWSYKAIIEGGRTSLIYENILNIVLFIPVGLLLRAVLQKKRLFRTVIVSIFISIIIEILQFSLKKGFSELDDVIHNTLGCVIGYGIAKMIILSFMSLNNREHNEGN